MSKSHPVLSDVQLDRWSYRTRPKPQRKKGKKVVEDTRRVTPTQLEHLYVRYCRRYLSCTPTKKAAIRDHFLRAKRRRKLDADLEKKRRETTRASQQILRGKQAFVAFELPEQHDHTTCNDPTHNH